MAIKDLPKYSDIRGTIRRKGRYPYVGTGVKDTIVIHHSATSMDAKGSTPQGFANHHIDANGWNGCAYPFVIVKDGTIYQTDDLDRRTYHAGDTNTRSIGICVAGNFVKGKEKPTQAQKDSLYLLVKELQKTLPKLTRILGHQECPGYSWKNCPGDNWSYKEVLKGNGVSAHLTGKAPAPAPTPSVTSPSSLPEFYTIQQGDTFWSLSRTTKLTVDQIQALNPTVKPTALVPGMKIRLKSVAAAPAPTPVAPKNLQTTDNLNLRDAASTSGKILVTIPKGKVIAKVSNTKQGDWLNVKYGTITGWVNGKYVTETTAAVSAVAAPAPKPTAPVLYRLQTGTFKTKAQAESGVKVMKREGIGGLHYIRKDGSSWRVWTGTYNTKADAEKAVKLLKSKCGYLGYARPANEMPAQ